jgi:hypothetical protein
MGVLPVPRRPGATEGGVSAGKVTYVAQYQASSKAADAPDIEAAMYDALFVSVEAKRVAGGQYTKDKERGDPKLEWNFKLLDDDGAVIRNDNEESENFGKPVIVSKLTGVGFNIASKTVPGEVKLLKALLTPAEFAAFEAGAPTPADDKDAPEGLVGRKVQVEVFIKENGWPGVGNVIAARKPKKATKAADSDE